MDHSTIEPLNRVFLQLGPITIYWYAVFIMSGVALGLFLAIREGKKMGINSEFFYDLVTYGLPISIIGARIYYVAFSWDYYSSHPEDIIKIWQGGIAIHGAIIAAFIFGYFFCKKRKVSFWLVADIASVSFIIAQAIGRWGNFMNREAHGAVTDTFLKMGLRDASGVVTYYHPTFLYESVWNLIGFIGLHFFSKKRKFDGEVFLAYVAWYGLGRVWIEGLRTDSLYLFSTGIRVSQLVAAVSFLAAAGILAWVLVKKKPARESLYVNRKREEPQADEKQAD